MIGPGCMPSRPRPISAVLGRRTLPYTRRRKPRRWVWRYSEDMIFDQPPGELPMATVVPRASRARLAVIAGDLQRWLAVRWRWFRPRTIPVIAAFIGMFAVIGAGRYLSRLAQQRPERLVIPLEHHVVHGGLIEITTTSSSPRSILLVEDPGWTISQPQTIELVPVTSLR